MHGMDGMDFRKRGDGWTRAHWTISRGATTVVESPSVRWMRTLFSLMLATRFNLGLGHTKDSGQCEGEGGSTGAAIPLEPNPTNNKKKKKGI